MLSGMIRGWWERAARHAACRTIAARRFTAAVPIRPLGVIAILLLIFARALPLRTAAEPLILTHALPGRTVVEPLGVPLPRQAGGAIHFALAMQFVPLPTATPFLPAANTPVPPTPAPSPTATLPPTDPLRWDGLDFGDHTTEIRLDIDAPAPVNRGRPVTVAFRTGWPCAYEDHRACISAQQNGRILLATVHSGVGGEGQMLRNALEGTGLNRAAFSLAAIQENLDALQGAPVAARQGDAHTDLRVLAAARVPAAQLDAYFSSPFDEALQMAAEDNPALAAALAEALARDEQLLVIETCGWRHPAEAWAPGVTDTSGSVYLVVIGQ